MLPDDELVQLTLLAAALHSDVLLLERGEETMCAAKVRGLTVSVPDVLLQGGVVDHHVPVRVRGHTHLVEERR